MSIFLGKNVQEEEIKGQAEAKQTANTAVDISVLPKTDGPSIKLPLPPKPPLGKGWKFGIAIIVLAGLAVIFIASQKTKKPAVKPQPPQTPAQIQAIKTAPDVGALINLSPIAYPKMSSQIATSATQTPESLKDFVLAGAQDLQNYTAGFDNQKTGFHLTYTMPRPLSDVYYALRGGGNWQILKSAVTNQAALTVAENPNFSVFIIQTSLDASNTSVSIIAVINPH